MVSLILACIVALVSCQSIASEPLYDNVISSSEVPFHQPSQGILRLNSPEEKSHVVVRGTTFSADTEVLSDLVAPIPVLNARDGSAAEKWRSLFRKVGEEIRKRKIFSNCGAKARSASNIAISYGRTVSQRFRKRGSGLLCSKSESGKTTSSAGRAQSPSPERPQPAADKPKRAPGSVPSMREQSEMWKQVDAALAGGDGKAKVYPQAQTEAAGGGGEITSTEARRRAAALAKGGGGKTMSMAEQNSVWAQLDRQNKPK